MKIKQSSIFAFLLLSASLAFGAPNQDIGTQVGGALGHSSNSRLTGMGGAGVALGDDISVVSLNPAGLGTVAYPEFAFNRQAMYEDIDHSQADFLLPLSGVTSANWNNFGAFALSAEFMDYGELNGRDGTGTQTSTFDADERLFALAYGKKIYQGLSAGVKAKYYRYAIADFDNSAIVMDGGLRYQAYKSPWSVGALLQNMGSRFQLDRESHDLPETFIAGFAFTPLGERLTLAADFVDPKYDEPGARGGVEYWLNTIIGIRGGYSSAPDAGSGFSAGLSIQVLHAEAWFFPLRRLRFDYSLVFPNEDKDGLEGTHQLALSFQFGEDGGVSR